MCIITILLSAVPVFGDHAPEASPTRNATSGTDEFTQRLYELRRNGMSWADIEKNLENDPQIRAYRQRQLEPNTNTVLERLREGGAAFTNLNMSLKALGTNQPRMLARELAARINVLASRLQFHKSLDTRR